MTPFATLLDQIRTATTMAGLNRAYQGAIRESLHQYRADRTMDNTTASELFSRQQQEADDAWNERAARGGFVA